MNKYISNARLLDHFGSELVYILPTDRQKGAGLENFETLFAALDRHMGKLQICSYGLSDTTLEEVRNFMRCTLFRTKSGDIGVMMYTIGISEGGLNHFYQIAI